MLELKLISMWVMVIPIKVVCDPLSVRLDVAVEYWRVWQVMEETVVHVEHVE